MGLRCESISQIPSVILRASRRGQNPDPQHSSFAPQGAPGSWGQAYDTDVNAANWGTWTPVTTLKLRNSEAGEFRERSGTPASVIAPEVAYVQVGDPISSVAKVEPRVPSNDYRFTSLFKVTDISGPESASGDGHSSLEWSGIAVAGPFMSDIVPLSIASGLPPPWVLGHPSVPLKSPEACDPTPCDADHTAVPHPPHRPNDLTYGTHPDSKTPYVALEKRQPWTLLKGVVKDSLTGEGIAGVSIIVVDRQGQVKPIAKLSHRGPREAVIGAFKIILPWAGVAQVFINPREPVKGIPVSAYDFDPRYGSLIIPNAPLPADMSKPGTTNVQDLGEIRLPQVHSTVLGEKGSGLIEGIVTAQENPGIPLPRIVLRLRNPHGQILRAQKTDSEGRYAFKDVPAGQFFIDAVLRRSWLSIPANRSIELKEGYALNDQSFLLRGVPATVDVKSAAPGTLAVLTSSEWIEKVPPSPRQEERKLAIYSSTVEENGLVRMYPAIGQRYYLTCWVPDLSGQFTRTPALGSVAVHSAKALLPTDQVEVACP
jgi:hypothetical protein